MSVPMKRCPYCQRLHPDDDFVKVVKGRGGRTTVTQCGNCYRARQNPAANTERLAAMVADNKAANRRAYGHFEKEKSR